jgi:hypothetical protein
VFVCSGLEALAKEGAVVVLLTDRLPKQLRFGRQLIWLGKAAAPKRERERERERDRIGNGNECNFKVK